MTDCHEAFMGMALHEAQRAAAGGEVPVGCIVVDAEGTVVARAHNLREAACDATAHAEILAIRAAGQTLGSWRLSGCTVYVTLEPCPMCAGAMVQARVKCLVFGAADPKAWADRRLSEIVQNPLLNHRLQVIGGIRAAEAAEVLQRFFRGRRGCSPANEAL